MIHKVCRIAGVIALALLPFASPAQAGVRVYVHLPPPPRIIEIRPDPPHRAYAWRPGYHRWDGHHYTWVHGYWVQRPRRHAVWVSGHWARERRGWYRVPGHWR